VRFHLTYWGELRGHGDGQPRIKGKHAIREQIRPQLARLWTGKAFEGLTAWTRPTREQEPPHNTLTLIHDHVEVFRFVLFISPRLSLVAELDILFMAPGATGPELYTGGDLDNRLETLLDGLRMPNQPHEVPQDARRLPDGEPYYCLLEDDSLIADLWVRTDRPSPSVRLPTQRQVSDPSDDTRPGSNLGQSQLSKGGNVVRAPATLTLMLLILSSTVHADFPPRDASDFLKQCMTGQTGQTPAPWCSGYIAGVADSYTATTLDSFCSPDNAKIDQLGRVAIKYMQKHPADLHRLSPALLIMQALSDAFPCHP